MKFIHLTAILMAAGFILLYDKIICPACQKKNGEKKKTQGNGRMRMALPGILLAAFVVRIFCALAYRGFETDINCFTGWSDMVFRDGFSHFYTSEAFTDYPPGYMYILWLIGAVRSLFHLDAWSKLTVLLIKLPAILCDLAAGALIYRAAGRRIGKAGSAALCAVYLFNPVILLNSSIWGQVDAVFTLCVVLMCCFVSERRLPFAYFAFAAGVLIKPQTLIFTPVLIYGIVDQVFLENFSAKKFRIELGWGLLAIASMVLLILPFGFSHVLEQYTRTLGSYPYASINGYNFWTMLGLNWAPQDGRFLFFTYHQWGLLFIVLLVLASAVISFRAKKDRSKYFFTGAFIVAAMFMLSVRMHERYLFPVLILLLFAFLYRPQRGTFFLYVLFSVVSFYNTAHALFYYDPANFNPKAAVPVAVAIGGFLTFLFLVYYAIRRYGKGKEEREAPKPLWLAEEGEPEKKERTIRPSEKKVPFRRVDFVALLIILLVYSGFALRDLGNRSAPETGWESERAGDQIVLDLGEDRPVSKLSAFLGNYEKRIFSAEMRAEDGTVTISQFEPSRVFAWNDADVSLYGRYLSLTLLSDKASVKELVITDSEGNPIRPVNAPDYPELFDEQAFYPKRSTFRDSTYFDEIYHARTAYEYIHGLYCYENTHPPLGKGFISLGIRAFGMNPFGWRIMGTLFGIAMLPFFYLFALRLTKRSSAAIVTTVLFAFDFMHFAQTRIATIDVFVTFFIILMYYFMFRYQSVSFYDSGLKKTLLPLGLSGICMGFGIACKWTGVYAGAGLAVIFFSSLYRRYQEYRFAKEKPDGRTNGISHEGVIKAFRRNTLITLGFCVVFFVLLPALIYTLSYLPFSDGRGEGLIRTMLRNQETMFSYHTSVDATHPYSSWWYQWPVMYRPIWYYSGHISETVSEGISAFGNPLVWWAGIPAFFYMAYLALIKRDRTAGFLCVAYLFQYVPWMFVTRITFIYHYFPSVPFIALMLGHAIRRLSERWPAVRKLSFFYAGLAVLLFVLFYPVLSGQPVDKGYVSSFLRWFPSWVLVS